MGALQYLVCGGDIEPDFGGMIGVHLLADGENLVLEGPWPLGRTRLYAAADPAAFARLDGKLTPKHQAFAVEGFAEAGSGGAFVIAAHRMLDAQAFRPYAEAIPDLLERFGVRSLARAGKVTPFGKGFAPERGVVLEFSSPEAVLAFYTSEIYAPLLALRLRTTDPRFMLMARSGPILAPVRVAAETWLAARPGHGNALGLPGRRYPARRSGGRSV